ncbi:hypothetical protein IMY05_008G0014300 [Salix suchowensis]|nr:hypothetical protein IMY05_008G0014300 [Salix suchowensis]
MLRNYINLLQSFTYYQAPNIFNAFLQNLLEVLLNCSLDRESSAHYKTKFLVEITQQACMILLVS